LLNDKIYTAYPKIEILKKKNNNEVEVDKNIITGKSFESTIEFAKEIVFRINKY
jgi:putative intracellular protease/amidase